MSISYQLSIIANSSRSEDTASSPSSTNTSSTQTAAQHDDVEINRSPIQPRNPAFIGWGGPSDPYHPQNWVPSRKWTIVVTTSLFTLVAPVSSSIVAPALPYISSSLNVTNSTEQVIILSIFVLGFAFGPLVISPLSELYGRAITLQLSNVFFLCFNLGCGFAKTKEQLIVFRFLAGFGGSAPLAIGGGVLTDLFRPEERGLGMSVYSLAPLLGPAIGPLAGGFIVENVSWRWCFHAVTITGAIFQCIGLVFLKETYPPVLLQRISPGTEKSTLQSSKMTVFRRTIGRSIGMILTQVIVQVFALYMMFLYGIMYLVLTTYPTVWDSYGMSAGIGGLNYIALGLGFFIGSQTCALLQDYTYKRLKHHYGLQVGLPEFRVPVMVPGAVLVPLGLIMYGWTAHFRLHWILPDIGIALYACGTIICFQTTQSYLIDCFQLYAASAIGAVTLLRSISGCTFPLFAPNLYEKLGYGWGNSLLAFIGIALGWPMPFLIWTYGKRLRLKKPFGAAVQAKS